MALALTLSSSGQIAFVCDHGLTSSVFLCLLLSPATPGCRAGCCCAWIGAGAGWVGARPVGFFARPPQSKVPRLPTPRKPFMPPIRLAVESVAVVNDLMTQYLNFPYPLAGAFNGRLAKSYEKRTLRSLCSPDV